MIRAKVKTTGADKAMEVLRGLAGDMEQTASEIARRLADEGFNVAYEILANHIYKGETIESLEVIEEYPGRYVLTATSGAILFMEFGAGARYGSGHPWAGQFGMGPGTYPGQTHAFNPRGWWFETSDPNLIVFIGENGKTYGHSYGNAPHMPFYQASARMRDRILDIAREVLERDRH